MAQAKKPPDREKDRQRAHDLMAKVDDPGATQEEQRTAAVEAARLIKRSGLLDPPAAATTTPHVAPQNAAVVEAEHGELTKRYYGELAKRYYGEIDRVLGERREVIVRASFNEEIPSAVAEYLVAKYREQGYHVRYTPFGKVRGCPTSPATFDLSVPHAR